MNIPELKAVKRSEVGTRASRRVRDTGQLPGIIYGHGKAPEAIAVSAHDLEGHLHHGARVLNVDIEGVTATCLIKDIQYDHLDKDPIHIDLTRVDMNERVELEVTVELRGTPKGISDGGVLEQGRDSIRVSCLAINIPDTLRPSVAHLGVDEELTVKDLVLPEGVEVLDDPDERIATVRVLTAAAETEEIAEGEAEPAEPERIGRTAEKEESNES